MKEQHLNNDLVRVLACKHLPEVEAEASAAFISVLQPDSEVEPQPVVGVGAVAHVLVLVHLLPDSEVEPQPEVAVGTGAHPLFLVHLLPVDCAWDEGTLLLTVLSFPQPDPEELGFQPEAGVPLAI